MYILVARYLAILKKRLQREYFDFVHTIATKSLQVNLQILLQL